MNRTLSTMALALATGLSGTIASAADPYKCVVVDFIGFEKIDRSFIEKNLRKRFELQLGKETVVVRMDSDDFEPSENTYRLENSNYLDSYYVRDGREAEETLSIPTRIDLRLENKGHFNATISLQSSFYNNAWLLRCVE